MGRIAWTAVLALGCGCIDVDEERGTYGTPCASFSSLLRCDRESGGADPRTDPTDDPPGEPTCESVCALLGECGFFGPAEIAACNGECEQEAWPVDCVYQAGCNIDAINSCFGDDL